MSEFIRSKLGTSAAVALVAPLVALATFVVIRYLRDGPSDAQYYTTYICTETGKSFRHRNQVGETLPIKSPFSGKATGVPAEACYWTKAEPTWVLVNEFVGKHEPTFCPDCGRLVVGHNPRPGPGVTPPPTADEQSARLAAHPSKGRARSEDR